MKRGFKTFIHSCQTFLWRNTLHKYLSPKRKPHLLVFSDNFAIKYYKNSLENLFLYWKIDELHTNNKVPKFLTWKLELRKLVTSFFSSSDLIFSDFISNAFILVSTSSSPVKYNFVILSHFWRHWGQFFWMRSVTSAH